MFSLSSEQSLRLVNFTITITELSLLGRVIRAEISHLPNTFWCFTRNPYIHLQIFDQERKIEMLKHNNTNAKFTQSTLHI